jgi:hypothetical protein
MTDADQRTEFVEDNPGLETDAEAPIARWNLDAIVSELRFSREVSHNIRPKGILRQSPSRDALSQILDDLAAALFPTHYGQSELRRNACASIKRSRSARGAFRSMTTGL